jgi:FkbM family methyltransferase
LKVAAALPLGKENMGLDNMKTSCGSEDSIMCKEVPIMTLDEYTKRKKIKGSMIHYLSIDVEGFDYNVILGASQTLKRVQYLEFEYNWSSRGGIYI